jgi:hypothetical protein
MLALTDFMCDADGVWLALQYDNTSTLDVVRVMCVVCVCTVVMFALLGGVCGFHHFESHDNRVFPESAEEPGAGSSMCCCE